ncbi:MAG: hypothetical protein LBP20_09845, partial [Treponema sp.]|nr:hypothetical protein [Treponema sp.]
MNRNSTHCRIVNFRIRYIGFLTEEAMAVRQVFVEKKPGFDGEAARLREDLANFLGCPELTGLRRLRILNRYLVEGLDDGQFRRVTALVFSEPQCDHVFDDAPLEPGDCCFGVEYLPGQYDQRSDSAEQCAELAAGVRPRIRSGRLYILKPGDLPVSGGTLETVKRYLINPVDSREASLEVPPSLEDGESPVEEVPVLRGFTDDPEKPGGEWARSLGLAMSAEDLRFCRDYFASAGRDPSLAELRVLDTYWSDHCRHTTFTTMLEQFDIEDPAARRAWELYEAARREVYGPRTKRPRTLMDIATIGLRVLKKRGLAGRVEESAEINACTIRVEAEFGASVRADNSITDGEANGKANDSDTTEPWLLLFKNETHNHPTEIEPFGGAATCLGGAIRDPLSGRAYVYQAMRISGGADPRERLEHTLRGKLPQIKIAHDAAAGYSSYGNQIGLATGQVAEFYHSGFLAKRLELGAVIAAVPAAWVRREEPAPGDVVILVGGKTGRDGIGGATGSSKMHSGASVTSAGAEVQKGNAVEERKLQRLFRSSRAAALIKRCNDFGAGGVAVAAGELAAGLDINLDAVPKKYAGLNGVELAISESQERMAVVVAAADADEFIALAAAENLDAAIIAEVTGAPRLRMFWRGKAIVDLDRKFLDSNGAPRSARLRIPPAEALPPARGPLAQGSPRAMLEALERELGALRSGSRRGLQERFDGSIGAASVLFPWGGAEQGTPECGMAALLPSLDKPSRTASLFCFGYDPDLLAQNPYLGAKGAVREALAKIACLGGDYREAYLSLQEYFERPESPETWGKPALALLGALEAQLELGVPAIGGKDSMSGNYRDRELGIDITVPPTLAAFAAGTCAAESVRSGALAGPAGAPVILLAQGRRAAEGGPGDRGGPPFRQARSISGAQDILRDITQTNKAFTNRARNITATISGNSIGKLGSEKAVRKSVSALVHAHAVANIDRLFEHAGIAVTHPDERGDTNINHIHRFGTVMEYSGEYYPVKITVKEFEQNNDGTRIYSVEVLDIEKMKKSAGQLVPSLDKPGRDTPIADFNNSLLDLYRRVKGEAQDEWGIFRANMAALGELGRAGLVTAAYPVQSGGAAVSLA